MSRCIWTYTWVHIENRTATQCTHFQELIPGFSFSYGWNFGLTTEGIGRFLAFLLGTRPARISGMNGARFSGTRRKRLYTIWIYPETVGLFHILGTFKRLKGAYVRMCVRYRRQHDARKSLEIHRIEWRGGWESNCIPNLHRHAKTTGPGRHRWRSTDRHSDLC